MLKNLIVGVVTPLLTLTLTLAAYGKEQERPKPETAVQQCQRECKTQADPHAYERCMLQCKGVDLKKARR